MQNCMDWRSVTFDWNQARAFLVTAEEGSLSAAARALGLTQPTLGRQVAALEDELGVALFERIGRRLELTPSGLELIEHVRAMGDAANRVSLAASGQAQSVEGSICITASEAFSVFLMPAIVARIRRDHPGIEVEVIASNSVSDLRRREADIAVRHAPPTDPELFARRLKDQGAALYATPDYIDREGPFETTAALSGADFIGFADNEQYVDGLKSRGLALTPHSFPIQSGSHLVHWEMAKQGLGIGVMSTRIGDREPLVRRAATWFEPFMFPVWLVAHREVRTSRRVRLVFDLLAEELVRMDES